MIEARAAPGTGDAQKRFWVGFDFIDFAIIFGPSG